MDRAVGVLRELSRAEADAVVAFIEAHRGELSKEAFARAAGQLSAQHRTRLT